MRVNPQYLNNVVAALDQTTLTEQQLAAQLSSGLRVNQLSDDPVASGQNELLSAQISRDTTFSHTATSTESLLQLSDSVLGSVVSQMNTAIGLATEGNNGTLTASDIQSIASQLAGIRDEVVSLANTSYMGKYLFAGSLGTAEPYALDTTSSPAVATYNGDAAVQYLETPNGQKIQLNLPGGQIFSAAGNDVMATLNRLVADFASGTATATAGTDVTDLTKALNYVGQQRVLLDNSLTRMQVAATYTQTESTQLLSIQTNLMQADVAQISTRLSTAQAQETALSAVITSLEKGSLFDYLQ